MRTLLSAFWRKHRTDPFVFHEARLTPPPLPAARACAPAGKSGFVFFSMEKRPGMVEENNTRPDKEKLSFGDFGRKLGAAWNQLTPEEKAPYSEKAVADKARYAEAMKTYVPDHEPSESHSSDLNECDSSMED